MTWGRVMREEPTRIVAAVIDVETTGFSPYSDEIIELGMVLFSIDLPVVKITRIEEYSGLREPGCMIHPRASAVNGITLNVVRGHTLDFDRAESIIERSHLLIAHNASFDKGFTGRLLPSVLRKPWYCTMKGIDWYGNGFESKRLQYLLKEHAINIKRSHRALDDACACLDLISSRPSLHRPYILEMLASKPIHLPREHIKTIRQIAAALQ